MIKKIILFAILVSLIFSCGKDSSDSSSRTVDGQAGSLAKMIPVGNNLYVINQSELQIFDISDPCI